ncbi:MAG TPA: carboxypeptidase regulatory-like domain-containing protein [Candidatus Kapabacteria bacterium]|nr:carboxypeptidase regulatory-like domain-containing protein [Candidatus Kapabacteria bacterium]
MSKYLFPFFVAVCFVIAGCAKHDSGATIAGTVTLSGACPSNAVCSGMVDAGCGHCSATAEHWIAPNGKVANALIYIKDGLGNTVYPTPENPVVLDQRGCEYYPHVAGVMLGQKLKILNSDPTLHNVHLTSANAGEDFNKLFTQGMPPMEQAFATTGIKAIKCDVHQWMKCYVGVFSNPFFAVSDSTGHYEIHGLPPGNYTLELWHESSSGADDPIVETRKISIGEDARTTADFSIAAR